MIKHAWRNAAISAGHICRICHEPIPDKDWEKVQKNGQRCEACCLSRSNELIRKRGEEYNEYDRRKDGY